MFVHCEAFDRTQTPIDLAIERRPTTQAHLGAAAQFHMVSAEVGDAHVRRAQELPRELPWLMTRAGLLAAHNDTRVKLVSRRQT